MYDNTTDCGELTRLRNCMPLEDSGQLFPLALVMGGLQVTTHVDLRYSEVTLMAFSDIKLQTYPQSLSSQ